MKRNKFNITILLVIFGYAVILSSCNNKEAGQATPPDVEVVNVIQKDVPIYREFRRAGVWITRHTYKGPR